MYSAYTGGGDGRRGLTPSIIILVISSYDSALGVGDTSFVLRSLILSPPPIGRGREREEGERGGYHIHILPLYTYWSLVM